MNAASTRAVAPEAVTLFHERVVGLLPVSPSAVSLYPTPIGFLEMPDFRADTGERLTTTWGAYVDAAIEGVLEHAPKSQLPLTFALSRCHGNGRPSAEHELAGQLALSPVFLIDFDDEEKAGPAFLRAAYGEVELVAWTTSSHLRPKKGKTFPRWRVALLLDREVSPSEYRRLGAFLKRDPDTFGVIGPDTGSPLRGFYPPCLLDEHGPAYAAVYQYGEPLAVDSILRVEGARLVLAEEREKARRAAARRQKQERGSPSPRGESSPMSDRARRYVEKVVDGFAGGDRASAHDMILAAARACAWTVTDGHLERAEVAGLLEGAGAELRPAAEVARLVAWALERGKPRPEWAE